MDMRIHETFQMICRRTKAVGGKGHCPAHDDREASLSIAQAQDGTILLKCFAGCQITEITRALGISVSDLFPKKKPAPTRKKHKPVDFGLAELAEAKKIPIEKLRSWGLVEVRDDFWGRFVRIPYFNEDGKAYSLMRRRLGAPGRMSNWKKGDKPTLYGRQWLQRIRELGWVIFVEGESDCWTLWEMGFPALGVPGSSLAEIILADDVRGLREIFVFIEPDRGGDTFRKLIAKRLEKLGYLGKIYQISLQNDKDPNAAYRRVGADAAKKLIQDAMDEHVFLEKSNEKKPGNEKNLTDLGNAERLIEQHGENLRYVAEWHKWLIWDGIRWRMDRTGAIMGRAKQVVRSLYAEAEDVEDEREQKKIIKHALASESELSLRRMEILARTEDGIAMVPENLDRDTWLIAVKNGVIDLRRGELQEARREDYITRCAGVEYNEDAKCPQWEKFLDTIFEKNVHLIFFVRKALGYSLTGSIRERCIFILWGVGRNGKSTLLDVIQSMMGEYAMRTPTDTLMMQYHGQSIPNDVARLKGARFVTASESEEGQRIAESKIKDLTGGDIVSARFMRGEFFDFKPEFKLWLGTNHKPQIRGTDAAIWDRIRLVPFHHRISEKEKDPEMAEKLKEELPGIFKWVLDGCIAYQQQGLQIPPEVAQANDEYRQEMDIVGEFFDDCCVIGEPWDRITSKNLYLSYRRWCERNAYKVISQKMFGQRLIERGIKKTRDGRARYWIGVKLAEEEEIELMAEDREKNL